MEICGFSTIINFTPKKHKIWKIRCFQVSWNCIKSLHIYLTLQYIAFIDQKEPIQVEKALNNSFFKTFNLTKRTLMYHCASCQLGLNSSVGKTYGLPFCASTHFRCGCGGGINKWYRQFVVFQRFFLHITVLEWSPVISLSFADLPFSEIIFKN